jgi:hypothetical protein
LEEKTKHGSIIYRTNCDRNTVVTYDIHCIATLGRNAFRNSLGTTRDFRVDYV